MDSVEKLFAALPDPDVDRTTDGASSSVQVSQALREFIKDEVSDDMDYEYLLDCAQKSFKIAFNPVIYFRQQLAHLAVQKPVDRKDKSQKARQLKYYRWIALGKKNESYPFVAGEPQGPPSTAKITAMVGPTTCAACGKNGANMRCPDCNFLDDVHVVEKTAYCNKNCLHSHLDAHKTICEGRKMVYRAALLLEAIFLVMAENTFVHPISKAWEENGILYTMCDSLDRLGMTGQAIFVRFPKTLFTSDDMRQSVLVWGQSEEISLSLFPLIQFLFKRK
jgi:hypothetical protein